MEAKLATKVEFKKRVVDHARLEGEAVISIGTTTFAGDGERFFLDFNDVGLLFSHDDAKAFLRAARRAAATLDYGDEAEDASA